MTGFTAGVVFCTDALGMFLFLFLVFECSVNSLLIDSVLSEEPSSVSCDSDSSALSVHKITVGWLKWVGWWVGLVGCLVKVGGQWVG